MAVKIDRSSLMKTIDTLHSKLPGVLVDPNKNEIDTNKKILLDSPRLNYVFGGSFQRTRIHQIFGKESNGKSTLSYYIGGQLQKHIGAAYPGKDMIILLDFERTFDVKWATNLGLQCDPEHLIVIHADTGEDAILAAEELIKTGCVCGLILDSDAAMSSRTEFEEVVNKATFGAGAKLMAAIARRFNVLCSNYEFAWIDISQTRKDIGAWSPTGIVPEKSTGGDAIKFYCSTRFKVTKVEELKQGTEKIGIKIKVKNIKNKTGVPWRECEMNLYFKGGFDSYQEYIDMIVDLADDLPDVQKPSKVMYESSRFKFRLRGKEAFENYLKENKEVFEELKKQVDETMQKKLSSDTDEQPDDIDDIEDTPESLAMQAIQEEDSKENQPADES